MSVFDRFFKVFMLMFLPFLLLVNLILTTGLAEHLSYLLTGGFYAPVYNVDTYFGFDSILQAIRVMPEFKPLTHIVNSVYTPISNIANEITKIANLDISADVFNLFAHVVFLPIELAGYATIALLEIMTDILQLGMWINDIFIGKFNEPLPKDPYAGWYINNLI